MKKIALVIATAALALGVSGCQNWTGGKGNCCKSKCRSMRCCKSNKANCGKKGGCRGMGCCSNHN